MRGTTHNLHNNIVQIKKNSLHISLSLNYLTCFVAKVTFQFCRTPVLGLGLGVDLTFTWDNNNNNNNEKNNNDKNTPHLNFLKGTALGDKEQGVGLRDKG